MLLGKEKLSLFCSGSISLKLSITLYKLHWQENDYHGNLIKQQMAKLFYKSLKVLVSEEEFDV